MPVTIVCVRCQRDVTIKADHANRGQRWCNMACWMADQQQRQVEKCCERCVRIFYVPPSLAARRYCCRACAVASRWHVGLFWAQVNKHSGYRALHMESDCWLWTGATCAGYGALTRYSRDLRAHRLADELAYGPFDAEWLVCHRCDTRLCVRADHLFLGTQLDNVQDSIRKGRHSSQR